MDQRIASIRMLTINPHTKVYIARDPLDMRKQIDGLSLHVQEVLSLDPLSSHLFVFRNRSKDKLKVLFWDANGFCLLYKRLSRGRFHWPSSDQTVAQYTLRELQWLLEGMDMDQLTARQVLHFQRV